MKKTGIILSICVLMSLTSCGQSEKPVLNNEIIELDSTESTKSISKVDEERINVILDTLKNDYYWKLIPSDLFGRVPTNFNWEEDRKQYPFRVDRDNYLGELNSLLGKNLSEPFVIELLNRAYHEKNQRYYFPILIEKLFSYQTDSAYKALYDFIVAHPKNHEIAIQLIEIDQHKSEIEKEILKASDDDAFAEHLINYLRIFDKNVDQQLLAKYVKHLASKLESEPFYVFLHVGVVKQYYSIEDERYENEETKAYKEKMHALGNGDEFEEARHNYWRSYAESVLKYHKKHK